MRTAEQGGFKESRAVCQGSDRRAQQIHTAIRSGFNSAKDSAPGTKQHRRRHNVHQFDKQVPGTRERRPISIRLLAYLCSIERIQTRNRAGRESPYRREPLV
jgi:hypothetical protein